MFNIDNPHSDVLYSLKGKVIYIEIVGSFFQGISDLGLVSAIIQDNTNIEIYGEYDDFTLERICLRVDYVNDLEEDVDDVFLFKVKFPISNTKLYFYEYKKEEISQ